MEKYDDEVFQGRGTRGMRSSKEERNTPIKLSIKENLNEVSITSSKEKYPN